MSETKTTNKQAPLPKPKGRDSYSDQRLAFRTDGNLTAKERMIFDVLNARNFEPMTVNEIADSGELNTNQINGAISVLLAKDYVVTERRSPATGGKAKRFVIVTASGKKAYSRPLDYVDPATKEKLDRKARREAEAEAKKAQASKAKPKAKKAKTPETATA